MIENTKTFERWIVEGSDGTILSPPTSLADALEIIQAHQEMCHQSYSASGPPPSHLVKGWKASKFGYLLKRVFVTVTETVVKPH